ncbi:hypothetical protein D049_3270A, partial [Vibrio parahaemolyticus VPTS-2010]
MLSTCSPHCCKPFSALL